MRLNSICRYKIGHFIPWQKAITKKTSVNIIIVLSYGNHLVQEKNNYSTHMIGKHIEGRANNFKQPINISRFPWISQWDILSNR